ncbi:hypothetical protein OS493_017366 [Desmophyllum pertusum]|uniref:Uncharacterized protein n=1 Tax=Desmophyllum pertusum TaxID=174260 RepID=A0A9X0A2J8_9CNID|nr:hypothetical protein OS493_017366 [Desmophyllum pertusum]
MFLVRFALFWILLALLFGTLEAEYKETADKLNEITNPEKYHKYLRPHNKGYPVNVTVRITVVHFVAVKEMDEEFSLDLVIWQQWKDPRLSHSLNYTITLPADSKKFIWLPDTVFLNVRSATIHDVISENSKVSINPEGLVTYSARITMTAGCPMDLTDYPIDEQNCDLEMSTYAYTRDELDFEWLEGSAADQVIVKDRHLAELALTGTEAMKEFEFDTDGGNSGVTHAKLRARFWFKRRLGYALTQIYIPTIMLVVLSWLAFWIPQESIPARVALGSTTVLSIVTFTGSFRGSMPKVSYIKAVDVYFIVSFAFIFAAVVEYVLVLLSTGVKRQRPTQFSNNNGNDTGHGKTESQELQEVRAEMPVSPKGKLNKRRLKSVRVAKEYMQYAFIKNEASSIDRVCRYFFPCCYAIFNLIYWVYYESVSFGLDHPASDA